MAITKIQAGALPADVITTAAIDDASITHAKLHTTMDLSSKTVTLPTLSTLNTTGNVLVGTVDTNVATNSGSGNDGVNIHPDSIRIARTDSDMLLLNRLNSDGDIIKFLKDGAAVGSIGANGSRAYMAGPQKGIKFGNVSADPCTDTGAAADNAYDLGGSSIRWKDLYLSGTAFAGSRISMNHTNGGIFFGTAGTNGGGGFADNGAIARAHANGYHSSGSIAGDLVIGAERQSDILFGTQSASTGSLATRMIIDSSGNVGIGTNSPSAKLEVLNTYVSDSTEQVRFRDNTGGSLDFYGYANATKAIQALDSSDNDNPKNLMLNPLGGNIGIGTTPHSGWYSNATALQIATTGSLYNTSNWEDVNLANNVYINTSGVDSYIQNDAACKIRLTDSGLMDFRVAGAGTAGNAISWTTAMAIDASGRVKIGNNETTIGDQQLFISGAKTSFVTLGYSLWQNQLLVHDNRIPSGGAGTEAGVGGSISFSAEAGGGQKTWLGLVEGYKQNNTAGDYGGGLKMRVRQNGNPTMLTGIAINSDAIVTKPYQPIGSFSHTASVNYSQDDLTSANFYSHTWVNQGNHFNASTGRFTCPVAGVYRIYFRATGSGNSNIRLRKNGSTVNEAYENAGTNHSVSSEAVVPCAANDYLHIQIASGNFLGGTQHKQVTFELMS
jgi:hypothetical protein